MNAQTKLLLAFFGFFGTMFTISTIATFLLSIDFFKKFVVYNDDGCFRDSSFGSSEDQTRFNNNSIIMTEWETLKYQPGEDRPGAMYVASGFRYSDTTQSGKEFAEKHLTIEKLPLVGFPEGVDFHPHGMSIHKPDNTLYVVNHAFENGGERIEVFDIVTHGSEIEIADFDNEVPSKLHYKYSITSDWMKREMNGILNSVLAVQPNKFYVTQYEAHAHDRSMSNTRKDLDFFGILFFKRKNTNVFYCEFDPANNHLDCKKAAGGFVLANGITHNADFSKIFVSDFVGRFISVFDRNPSTNELTHRIDVKTPHTNVDNIKFDPVSNKIYGAGLSNMYASFKNFALYPGQHKDESTSGLIELDYSTNLKKIEDHYQGWTLKNTLVTNKLNMITNGIRMNSHYVMGSGVGFDGILVCPIVKDITPSKPIVKDGTPSKGASSSSEL